MKDISIQDRAEGCKEKISWSLIKYMWTFEYRHNNYLVRRLKMLQEMYPQLKFYEVHSDRELREIENKILEK